jgi:hypothetical protein
MSPAKAEDERTAVRAIAIRNRLIKCVLLLKVGDARFLTSGKNRATSGKCCKAAGRELISTRGCKLSYTHFEGYSFHEDNLTEVARLALDGQ